MDRQLLCSVCTKSFSISLIIIRSCFRDGALAGPATKVFLSEDFSGQWYLCYILLSRFQLSIVKIDFTSNYPNISFGMLTSISAKDAVPIPVSLSMNKRNIFYNT